VSRLPFLLGYSLPLLHLVALELPSPWCFMVLAYMFVLIPVLDALVGHSSRESDLDEPRDGFHDRIIELWVPVQIALFGWTVLHIINHPPTTAKLVGICISMGAVTGAGGITIAHELTHRKSAVHRALAEVLMTMVLYTHFCVEHVYGHHLNVGTYKDAATARKGETVYAFVPRAIFTGMAHAWQVERRRCERAGIRGLNLRDRRQRYLLAQASLVIGLYLAFGPVVTLFFFGQAFSAILLLEVTDYVEHYGLTRAKLENGRHERIADHHSWNSTHALTSAYLFHLTRHSDHHMVASRPYDQLRARPEAPCLPAGYPTMMLLALLPPLWFKVMDPRAAAVERTKQALPA